MIIMPYAQIALPLPIDSLFDYAIPLDLQYLQIGMRVRVPFGKRVLTGVCVSFIEKSETPEKKIKNIFSVLDNFPVVTEHMIEFSQWMAKYYHCSLGEALEAVVPNIIKTSENSNEVIFLEVCEPETLDYEIQLLEKKFPQQSKVLKWIKEYEGKVPKRELRNKLNVSDSPIKTLIRKEILREIREEVAPDPFAHIPVERDTPPQLNKEQAEIVQQITDTIEAQQFSSILLHGVTGSGKTEIYLHSISEVIQRGKQAIVLIPEISLTPQTVTRFRRRFGDNIAVLHSELTPSQRIYQWQQIYQGNVQVVVGPRSALFAPTHKLGLIVVDEEHEPSFKQQNTPRYHARDLAVKRAQMTNSVVILGSATPSLESYYNAQQERYRLHLLPQRVGYQKMPEVTIVNMREECAEQKRFVYFSQLLLRELRKVLSRGEQAILFLNRRGFATNLTCPSCGYHAKCNFCDIALTYHKKRNMTLCHYCNTEYKVPEICPICEAGIRYIGAGTERIEKALGKALPDAKIFRMDSDTMIGRGKYEKVFSEFENKEIDILLGTQMIAKGLDFPSVTLVGIISADISLQIPDFRSAERTFQLIVQVAGRSGRGKLPGKVVLQTYHPQHYAIQTALHQNYEDFVRRELSFREGLGYPPFGRLLRIVIEGQKEEKVVSESQKIAQILAFLQQKISFEVLGPTTAPLAMIKSRYRYHLIVKCKTAQEVHSCAHFISQNISSQSNIRVNIDVDPVSLL